MPHKKMVISVLQMYNTDNLSPAPAVTTLCNDL